MEPLDMKHVVVHRDQLKEVLDDPHWNTLNLFFDPENIHRFYLSTEKLHGEMKAVVLDMDHNNPQYSKVAAATQM